MKKVEENHEIRINELKSKIQELRLSRRILMQLVENLCTENKSLKEQIKQNSLIKKNKKIIKSILK
jgi:ethanolamine utilization protein EutQ (cupin superfamily)